jgi:hypothetical protein
VKLLPINSLNINEILNIHCTYWSCFCRLHQQKG